jgi:hypothetical protein
MATYWHDRDGPWRAVPRGEQASGPNGDGTLLYPGNGASEATGQPAGDGPFPSIRLELLRESGEDHKLLSLAESRLGRGTVLRLTTGVYSGLDAFSMDPAPMRAARAALLRALH